MFAPIIAAMISCAAAAAPVPDTIPLSSIDTSCSDLPPFTGIYSNPLGMPMSQEQFNAYLAQGWQLVTVPREYQSVQVELRMLESGRTEWRCGTLPSGIAVIVSPDKTYARLCYSGGRVMATRETTPTIADDSDDFYLDNVR